MRRSFAVLTTVAMVAAACSSAATPSPSTGGGAAASPSAAASASAAPVSGPVVLSGWQSTGAEGKAVEATVAAAKTALPDLNIKYAPVSGDYKTVMPTKFAAHDIPDVFYVNAEYAPEWIDQGFLQPLDDYIAQTGFDVSTFFPDYVSIFKGTDGKIYGLPKDGNTIAMAYNPDLVPNPPKTMDELVQVAQSLKGKSGLKAPMCLNAALDRGLAFLYAQGGSLISDDKTTEQISSDASKTAVQWYMDLFKNGLGMTNGDLGDGWCGESLGKKHVAITFEGGWLDPAMKDTFPDVKYAWAQMPTGTSGSPVTISYTVSYSIGADSKNKDTGWALLSWLVGKDGMTTWTETGVALPARSDVPSPSGKDVLTAESSFAKPGSGFMLKYNDVQKAFGDAFSSQIQKKTFDAGPVVDATKAAITKALNG
jgi:multiple sugar transport system substrate-binding protein